MLCENVKSYLANSKGLPFFYVVGDEDYKEILSEFTQSGVIIDRVSDFLIAVLFLNLLHSILKNIEYRR